MKFFYFGSVKVPVEPSQYCYQGILSPSRLPFRHIPISGGSCQIRTGDHRVAVYCLTTWLRNHVKYSVLNNSNNIGFKMQHNFLLKFLATQVPRPIEYYTIYIHLIHYLILLFYYQSSSYLLRYIYIDRE